MDALWMFWDSKSGSFCITMYCTHVPLLYVSKFLNFWIFIIWFLIIFVFKLQVLAYISGMDPLNEALPSDTEILKALASTPVELLQGAT